MTLGLRFRATAIALGLTFSMVAGTSAVPASKPEPEARYMDSASGADWPGAGRTYGEQHFSPLSEINASNIARLGLACGCSTQALELARALAMSTYRSPEEFAARFSGAPRAAERGFVFPVEDYLMARGADYATRYQPDGFLCLSESIDLHRVDAGRIFVPVTAVAVREDQLVPVADMRAMVARLPHAKLQEISSLYGHDAFLKEADALRPIFAKLPGA